MLASGLRRPYLLRMRSRLLEQMRRPGIPQVDVVFLRRRLAGLGLPKSYEEAEPPTSTSVDPGPMPRPPVELDVSTYDSLSAHSHSLLFSYAVQHGLDVKPNDTKAQIVSAVWALVQGERT
jgi:hypothetical protein